MTRPATEPRASWQVPVPPPADGHYDMAYRAPDRIHEEIVVASGGLADHGHRGTFVPYPDVEQAPLPDGEASPTGPRVETPASRALWILAFVFAAVAPLVPLVGLAGIVCGTMSWSRGSSRGKLATLVAIAATLTGWALS